MAMKDWHSGQFVVFLIGLALAIVLSTPIHAQEATEYEPREGTLVIFGGGSLNGTGIMERFIEVFTIVE